MKNILLISMILLLCLPLRAEDTEQNIGFIATPIVTTDSLALTNPDSISAVNIAALQRYVPGDRINKKGRKQIETIYAYPEGNTLAFSHPDWKRMWINTGVLLGAFLGSQLVLECLPEDATSWNRAEFQSTPSYVRWRNHVLDEGFAWDNDKAVFNLFLHPYAGAAYFMSARSCGLSFWGSLLYSTCISNIGWELGIEAANERPSIQDIIITPLVGSAIGEGFYHLKRYLVNNDYHLFGSPVVGNIVAFLIDPVNEVIGLFAGNPARRYAKQRHVMMTSSPIITSRSLGLMLNVEF